MTVYTHVRCRLSWQRQYTTWSRILKTPSPSIGGAIGRSFANLLPTEYTIVKPGVDSDILEKTVTKHWEKLHLYLSEKPIAPHTNDTFLVLKQQLEGCNRPVIIDSGCGTGRSSQLLGQQHPDHIVIGVDRSLARLQRNYVYRQQSTNTNTTDDNVFLVRAELVDFWRLWLDCPLGTVEKHFLLYPNPYPKKSRYQHRWYAHPAFPLILQLGGEEFIVRSNWKAYLDDFAKATSIIQDLDSSKESVYETSQIIELDPSKVPLTNFEAKYFNVGERTYELLLRKK